MPVWVSDANVSFQQGEENVESLSSVAKGTKPKAEGPSRSNAFPSNGQNKREVDSDEKDVGHTYSDPAEIAGQVT